MLKISLVVPIFNNAHLLEDFISESSTVLNSGFQSLELEYIIINDGSDTENSEVLRRILVDNPAVRLLELTRNFGQHIALAYGFKEATGIVVVRVNPDLEDPLQVLTSMITCVVDEGVDLAKVVFRERKVRSFSILLSRIFAVLFAKISGFDVDAKEGSMRVMSRRYINSYNQLQETRRNPQGLDSWMGFKTKKFETDRVIDSANISTYSFGKKFKLATESVLYGSNRILNFVAVSGLATLIFSILGIFLLLIVKLSGNAIPGYISIALGLLMILSVQAVFLGILGVYLGYIFDEVKRRPLFLGREITRNEVAR